MEINPTKSKIMHIGQKNPPLPYMIHGMQIEAVTTEKDIGCWISDDLKSPTHVNKARSKALGEISRIRRNFSFIDKRAFCFLYNQRVRVTKAGLTYKSQQSCDWGLAPKGASRPVGPH